MKSSPMMMRIAELRIRSAPTIGPTVVALRTCPTPNFAWSAFSRRSNVVPGTTGASDGLGAATAAVAEADGVEEPLAPAFEDGEVAKLGVGVALGATLT